MKNKKGQTDIIITVLIILIALVVIAIASMFIINMVRTSVADAEIKSKSSVLYIEEAKIINNIAQVKVKFISGETPIKIKIVFASSSESQVYTSTNTIGQLETNSYIIPLNISNVKTITLYPVYNLSNQEKIGFQTDKTENIITQGSPIIIENCSDKIQNQGETGIDCGGPCNSCILSDPSLVSYYSFEGNAKDLMGRNNGTESGVVLVPGRTSGQAYYFDGINDYISFSAQKLLIGENYSFSLWIKSNAVPNASGSYGKFFSNKLDNLNQMTCGLLNTSLKIACAMYNGSLYYGNTMANQAINLNEWYMVTYVTQSSSGKLYLNGVLQTSSGNVGSAGTPNRFVLGASTSPGGYFNGTIDELRIYNRTLNSTEITALYNS